MAIGGLDALTDQGDSCKCPPGSLELLIAGLHSPNCPLRWMNDEETSPEAPPPAT